MARAKIINKSEPVLETAPPALDLKAIRPT